MNWDERIKIAKTTGRFNTEDKMLARSNDTSTIGEKLKIVNTNYGFDTVKYNDVWSADVTVCDPYFSDAVEKDDIESASNIHEMVKNAPVRSLDELMTLYPLL